MSVYPSVRSAIFSAICDYYGFDDADTDDALEATALTDKIMQAMLHVEGEHIDGVEIVGEGRERYGIVPKGRPTRPALGVTHDEPS